MYKVYILEVGTIKAFSEMPKTLEIINYYFILEIPICLK